MVVAAAAAPCVSPTLGADVTDISRAYRRERRIPDFIAGAFVRNVRAKSPAATAGIQPGDVIEAVDRELLQSACDFKSAVAKRGCAEIEVLIRRNRDTMGLTMKPVPASSLPATPVDDQRACQDGDGAACTALAKSHGETVDLLRLACDSGDPEGCYILGLKLRDDKEVARVYEQSCDGGYSQACTNLGWMYENARGVNKDLAAAARLYKRGCDGNSCYTPNNLGCVNLGRAFRDGTGVEANASVAASLFRTACSRTPVAGSDEDAATIARACALAGTASLMGNGVTRNFNEALRLLRRSCDANDTLGCYNLGTIYADGTGVDRDLARAVTFYRRACEHGDDEACARVEQFKK